jgi:uncharacterized membrane protein
VFAGLINQAKAAVTRVVLQYVARASVAVPFLIALGFALAAITLMLVQRFGHTAAYWMMAGGLVAIGVIAAIAVRVKEHEEEVAEERAEQTEGAGLLDGATGQAMLQAPLALLAAASAVPGGATTILKAARVLGRNYPVVLLVGLIGLLFWPTRNSDANALTEPEPKADRFQPAQTWH